MLDFNMENQALCKGHQVIAGVDEAGRGPWAGPVVAAAVVLDRDRLPADVRDAVNDSKRVKADERLQIMQAMTPYADIGVGIAEVAEIDTFNILQATLLAMSRAVNELPTPPDLCLVDGTHTPQEQSHCQTVIRGDGLYVSIDADSIVAKVTRDGIMADLAEKFPEYGWDRNAGYGTKGHRSAMEQYGITPIHRHSYRPVLNILREQAG